MKPWFDRKLFQFADPVDYRTRVLYFKLLQSQFPYPIDFVRYYSYLQIHHFMLNTLSADFVSKPTRFKKLCRLVTSTNSLILDIYRILIDPSLKIPVRYIYGLMEIISWYPNFS